MSKALPYRNGVVIAIFDARDRVLIGERSDNPGAWQLPQGGTDPGEKIADAARREATEELGEIQFTIEAISAEPIRYDFPPEVLTESLAQRYRGQSHYWVRARLVEGTATFRGHDGEFRAFSWVAPSDILRDVIVWRRATYQAGFLSLGIPLSS